MLAEALPGIDDQSPVVNDVVEKHELAARTDPDDGNGKYEQNDAAETDKGHEQAAVDDPPPDIAGPFAEILEVAFKGHYITEIDHPGIRRLRGEL